MWQAGHVSRDGQEDVPVIRREAYVVEADEQEIEETVELQ